MQQAYLSQTVDQEEMFAMVDGTPYPFRGQQEIYFMD